MVSYCGPLVAHSYIILPCCTIIEVEVEINASVDKVWDIVSDIDNEPKFWKGTKEIKNISKEGNTINREITIAFRDQKCLQKIKLEPKEKIEALCIVISGTGSRGGAGSGCGNAGKCARCPSISVGTGSSSIFSVGGCRSDVMGFSSSRSHSGSKARNKHRSNWTR